MAVHGVPAGATASAATGQYVLIFIYRLKRINHTDRTQETETQPYTVEDWVLLGGSGSVRVSGRSAGARKF